MHGLVNAVVAAILAAGRPPPGPARRRPARPARPAARRRPAAPARPAGSAVAAGSGDDAVVGRARRMAEHAVAEHQAQVGRAQRRQQFSRALSCSGFSRSTEITRCETSASSAAWYPHPVPISSTRAEVAEPARIRAAEQQLDHARDHRRLGDRLAHGRSAGWCPRRPGWRARRRRSRCRGTVATPQAPAARGSRLRRGAAPCARARRPNRGPGRTAPVAPARIGMGAATSRCGRSTVRCVAAVVPATRSSFSGNLRRERSLADISRPRWPSRARPAGWRDRSGRRAAA